MLEFVSLTIASILLLVLIFYSLFNRKYIKKIDSNFKFHESLISPFIYFLLNKDFINSNMSSSNLKIALKNTYGEDNFDYRLIVHNSIKLTAIFYIGLIFLIIISLTGELILYFFMVIFVILLNFYFDREQIAAYNREKARMKSDLPNFISRLSLMVNSGINLRTSINHILKNSSGKVVESLVNVQTLIKNGMSDEEAFNSISNKTDDILIRKFISSLLQNIKKGGDDLESNLELIKRESNDYRKTQIILDTQEANRKLLIPNLFIFLGIMLMVMLPILLNIL